MAKLNKNGIRILDRDFFKSLSRVKETKIVEVEDTSTLNSLEGQIVALLKEEAEAKKAAKKAANAAKMAAVKAKAKAEAKASAEAAAELIDFLFGERNVLISEPNKEILKATGVAKYSSLEEYKKEYSISVFEKETVQETLYSIVSYINKKLLDSDSINYDYGFSVFLDIFKKDDLEESYFHWASEDYIEKFKKIAKDVRTLKIGTMLRQFMFYIDSKIDPYQELPKAFSPDKEEAMAVLDKKFGSFIRVHGRYMKAKEIGCVRPDLARHFNISPEAFLYVETKAAELGLDPKTVYDSCGVWGLNPEFVAKAWLRSGAKLHPKFRYFVSTYLGVLKKLGRMDNIYYALPGKNESMKQYKERVTLSLYIGKNFQGYDELSFSRIPLGDRKRLGKLHFATRYYALHYAMIEGSRVVKTDYSHEYKVSTYQVDWEKVNSWSKLSKREKAKDLPLTFAWRLLFNRPAPRGLTNADPSPVALLDKVTRKTFMALMNIVKAESDGDSALEANTKAAYHLALIFRDLQSVKRWVSKIAGDLTAINIHDSYVKANALVKAKFKSGWVKLLTQFPDLRWNVGAISAFEANFDRLPESKREFVEFASAVEYEDVADFDVAIIASKFNLDEDEAIDYEDFFKETSPKSATMIPAVTVHNGDYKFRKLDDHDKFGPFLGLQTDCCQHLHNAGSSCAEAGYRDPESGFYVVEKEGQIIAQSWAWRGRDNSLCFDSIEAKSGINIERVANLYKEAATLLIGKLGIARVTVGNTSYGITKKVKKALNVKGTCEPSHMLKSVSYTDADEQWLLQ